MPTLADYETETRRLLNDTAGQEYATSDLDAYINTARGQIAASAQCVRYTGSLAVTSAARSYPLTGITGAPAGVANALSVYDMAAEIPNSGSAKMYPRPWRWAWSYWLSSPVPQSGMPTEWSVQEPGPLGSIYLNKTPDMAYTLQCDCAGQVADLSVTQTTEAIPYPYTDAVPYFAAYLALLNSQRSADADAMLQKWAQFASWGAKQLTPPVLPSYYPGGLGAAEAGTKVLQNGLGGGSR